jgi:hypothetical protein
MEEDFDLVHNLLYYIYTHEITFSTKTSSGPSDSGSPKIYDAEDVYILAHRLDLDDLKAKALSFLKLSCITKNITSRVLDKCAAVYDELDAIYTDYFRKNWSEIHETDEFQEYFVDLEENGDVKETNRVFKKFRELIKGTTFPPLEELGSKK